MASCCFSSIRKYNAVVFGVCLYACLCSIIILYAQPIVNFRKLTILTKPTHVSSVEWEHAAVMRSLLQGLDSLQVPYNYNPSAVDDIGDVLLVPCNRCALSQAVALKKQGRIKKLFVGPNFYPREVNYPEVDVYFVPSSWVITFAKNDCFNIASRCRVWYAGVDAGYWQAAQAVNKESKNVLVYWKTEPLSFCETIERLLKQYGWNPIRLQYGCYKPEQFKNILQRCRFAVFISMSESQGIALAECWAMDVPTLPWNPKTATIDGHQCDYVSSCPYLTSHTGVDWQTLSELKGILQSINNDLSLCMPRDWVVENMTDAVSVAKLVELINGELTKDKR
jgi:hypothetical protein